jgi:hypothetical protein
VPLVEGRSFRRPALAHTRNSTEIGAGWNLRKFQGAFVESLSSLWRLWWTFFYARCLVGFPWFWPGDPPGQEAMLKARRIVRDHFGREHSPVARTIAKILTAVVWPPAVLVNLWQARQMFGSDAVAVRQTPKAFWAAMRHNILPTEYFAYGLWQPDRMKDVDNYLYSKEAARLFKVVNKPPVPNPLSDKLAFYELCKAHKIATPEVLAAFAPTGTLIEFRFGRVPPCDLFIKTRTGLGGESAERFRWNGAMFESNRGPHISGADLIDYLATRARIENQTLLVQPLLSNHSDLHTEPNAALATARLVTGHSVSGKIIPLFGYICFARDDQITSLGNYLTLIDIENGRLIDVPLGDNPSASIYDYRQLTCNETGALPDWDTALQQISLAHRACARFVFVGWDVAFTDHGPIVLEGNENWCADTYQTLNGNPLGCTIFADILVTHLEEK